MINPTEQILQLRCLAARINAADDSAIGGIYLDLIGHDPVAEGEATAAEAREILRDYVRELCYSSGVHCSDVFGN